MIESNRDDNVFRYAHLRPAKGRPGEPSPASRLRPRTGPGRAAGTPAVASPSPGPLTPAALLAAKREVERLDPYLNLHLPGRQPDGNRDRAITLNERGVSRLSVHTRAVLDGLGAPAGSTPFEQLLEALDTALLSPGRRPRGRPAPGPAVGPVEPAHLRAVGIADLLVVKQQIKRYEAGEIAHVENVVAGESKVRTHRQLDRVEEVLATIDEREREKETESQTTERFELNRETTRTQEVDQKTGSGLSLSGKYGPGRVHEQPRARPRDLGTPPPSAIQSSTPRTWSSARRSASSRRSGGERRAHRPARGRGDERAHPDQRGLRRAPVGPLPVRRRDLQSQVFNSGAPADVRLHGARARLLSVASRAAPQARH